MKRYYYIISLLTFVCLPASAQTAGKNYVMTETMLNSSGTRKIVAVQYYDGLGRPSELAEGGISGSGSYLHSLQTYDALGREAVTTLPGANSSTPDFVGLTPTSTSLASSYGGDTRPYSQTTYDALGRPVFISTPGQNWTGRGKRIEYITNGENEVRRYSAGANAPTLSGYYPIGSLKAERVTDEDGIAVTTYKDLLGRVVLERRGENDDTYYVYDTKGLLRFVLQPMYQENSSSVYRFRYDYDNQGRLLYEYLPGCNVTQYWYDGAGRVIASRGAKRASRYRTRYFFYDGLGRLVVQGRAQGLGSNADMPLITSRTQADGTAEICHTGYYVDAARIPANFQLEIVNYYDDYAFFSSGIFTDSIPGGNFQATNSACTSTLKTGDITATSNGHLLARVYYYDERGRVIDTRENLLGGEFLRTTTSYSFTNKPTLTTKTISSPVNASLSISEYYTYDDNTDKLKYHDIKNSTDNPIRLAAYTYDGLGRLSLSMRNNNHIGVENTYNIHGWLTKTRATIFSKGYTPYFQQELSYESGSGTPCFNGNISAMRWKSSQNDNGHGYKFYYDNRNRLTEGRHTYYNFEDYPVLYNERISYNRNSSITKLIRRNGHYAVTDSLFYTYNGNRLSSIADFGTNSVYNGDFDFKAAPQPGMYAYNGAGDLTQDGNKGLTKIQYDYLGHPVRIQFSDGSCTEYVYAADGRKLREKHTTAVEGLTVRMGNTLKLTPEQTMETDSVYYAGNLIFRPQEVYNVGMKPKIDYLFDGGYLSLTPYAYHPYTHSPYVARYTPSYHYFIRDHQGNNRLVVDGSDNIEQTNEYYPYGGPWGTSSTNQAFQPYKYNSKELDRVHGLDWYDYGARRYDPAYCLFTQMDPLCEDTPHLNPYAYCAGNPVRYVDPDGRHVRVTRNEDGSYKVVEGGIVDGDLNIYDVTDGWDNRVSIGEALTQFSFFDDNEKPSVGSVIDLNDQSGQEFWDNFNTWAPIMPLLYYAYHARNGQKYDFKSQGEPYPGTDNNEEKKENLRFHNRGMTFNVGGNECIASGRDIGNYAAGYVAGLNGLSWQEARYGFDLYESHQQRKWTAEKAPTQSAQYKGYKRGWNNIGLIRRIIYKAIFP